MSMSDEVRSCFLCEHATWTGHNNITGIADIDCASLKKVLPERTHKDNCEQFEEQKWQDWFGQKAKGESGCL